MRDFKDSLAHLRGKKLWLALSGGYDSVLLFGLLHAHQPTYAYGLEVLHIDHQQSPDASQRAREIRAYVEGHGVRCRVVTLLLPPMASETQMRRARYQVFEALLEPDDYLLLGHHADDLYESWWLNLMRGAGMHRLDPIIQSRPLGQGMLFRPLLSWTKSEIQERHAKLGLPLWDDASNYSEHIERNFIRHRLLPLLRERYPRLEGQMHTIVTHHKSQEYWSSQALDHALTEISCGIFLSQKELHTHPDWARGDLIYRWALRESLPLEKKFILLVDQISACHKAYQHYQRVHVLSYRGWTSVWDTWPSPQGTLEEIWGRFFCPPHCSVLKASQYRRSASVKRGRCRVSLKKRAQSLGILPWFRDHWPVVVHDDGELLDWWMPGTSEITLTHPSAFAKKLLIYYAHMAMATQAQGITS